MANVMLVQPWIYHDEGIKTHDLSQEWRNGPYALILLATLLKKDKHRVVIVDMASDLVKLKGNVRACLKKFNNTIKKFQPDIIGFGFFSLHCLEVKRAVESARETCEKINIHPLFIAGGIHASIEPKKTIKELGFDYSFVGEADLGIIQLANGTKPENIQGIVGPNDPCLSKGEEVEHLDSLPFPDWYLCDYRFYSYPSAARLKIIFSKSLDMLMGRSCSYRCNFCAYNTFYSVRFYSAEYLLDQIRYMSHNFGVSGIYFIDSTIGNNRMLVQEFCEKMINSGMAETVEWYANMRANQVNEELLKLMWRAGCRYLLYGFESGSQRVLDLMNKKTTVEDNYQAAFLHNKLKFPYNASMIIGYPGEREEDILLTLEFLKETKPLKAGINCYVPLPGSPDYNKMRNLGIINIDDPEEWRKIGEVNPSRVYADVSPKRFQQLYTQAWQLVNIEIPKNVQWNDIRR
jgi:anaerobic magnesium-protoporphyrin IX monomethyl ester cyclase